MHQESDVVSRPKAPNRRLRLLLMVLTVVFLAAAYGWFQRQREAAAEQGVRQELRQLKAIVSMDTQGRYVATVLIRENFESALPLVAKLRHLSHLDLADTGCSDADLKYIRRLPRLYSLVLSNTRIGDEGLDALSRLPLESLLLSRTAITAAGVDKLGKISTLKVLDLSHTNVQGHLSPLASAPKLEWLELSGVDLRGISESAIDALARMPKLGRLTVIDTQIDENLVARLKAARPHMNIEVDPR